MHPYRMQWAVDGKSKANDKVDVDYLMSAL